MEPIGLYALDIASRSITALMTHGHVRLGGLQYPLRKTLPVSRFNAALLLRGVARKAIKMRFEARRSEIGECPNLRNGKPTLWGNEMHGHRERLVTREKDLQLALRELLGNVVREKSGDATPFHG
jgi:hypothetical protein